MTSKTLPYNRNQIEALIKEYGSPIHVYDEKGIRENARKLSAAFAWAPDFKNYFAVKATPNPYIMKILMEEGCGADCSSMAELLLAERVGMKGEEVLFTSNNTPGSEYVKASQMGAIINLDDISHVDYLEQHAGIQEMICFRYNPGPLRSGGNAIIGEPEEAKYGLTKAQLFEAYRSMQAKGAKRFGLHTMVISNELDPYYFIETATNMMFDLAVEIYQELGIRIELLNLGGGIGIPYRPEQQDVDLDLISRSLQQAYDEKITAHGLHPMKIAMECGRYMTGPFGTLITQVLHKKDIYKQYVGLDACMADLMRPALYGSYHHITVVGKEDLPLDHIYDVTGGLCENNDKFAINRALPPIDRGDILVIHDTGAHGHAMGFNYNGKLRSAEVLWHGNGRSSLIRRAETMEDLFATLDFSRL